MYVGALLCKVMFLFLPSFSLSDGLVVASLRASGPQAKFRYMVLPD